MKPKIKKICLTCKKEFITTNRRRINCSHKCCREYYRNIQNSQKMKDWVKEYNKEYRQRPEVKKRSREYQRRKYQITNKIKEYNKKYYQKHKSK